VSMDVFSKLILPWNTKMSQGMLIQSRSQNQGNLAVSHSPRAAELAWRISLVGAARTAMSPDQELKQINHCGHLANILVDPDPPKHKATLESLPSTWLSTCRWSTARWFMASRRADNVRECPIWSVKGTIIFLFLCVLAEAAPRSSM
jgi:hypothetical protein